MVDTWDGGKLAMDIDWESLESLVNPQKTPRGADFSLVDAYDLRKKYRSGPIRKSKSKGKRKRKRTPEPHVGPQVPLRRAMYAQLPRGKPVTEHAGLGPSGGPWAAEQMTPPW